MGKKLLMARSLLEEIEETMTFIIKHYNEKKSFTMIVQRRNTMSI